MANTPTIWPRAYLLDIYNKTLEAGFLWVRVKDETTARSLTQALYRLRRRSDTSNKSFILPEFHLITCGNFIPGKGLPVLYSKLPDDMELPLLEQAEAGTADLSFFTPASQQPILHSPSEEELLNLAGEKIEPADLGDYVSRMMAKAKSGSTTTNKEPPSNG